MGKAGVGQEPGEKWLEGTLSQVRERRRNLSARPKGFWEQKGKGNGGGWGEDPRRGAGTGP